MIKATVKEENNEGRIGVELQFNGSTTNVLYEHSMLTLALLSRLTSRTEDPIKRKQAMLRMLDAFGEATAMLITRDVHTDEYCQIAEQSSVVIDQDMLLNALNRRGDDDE